MKNSVHGMSAASEILRDASSVHVITGAGISVPSGVRPYRGPGGLYNEQPELAKLMTASTWREKPNAVWREIDLRRKEILSAKPNRAHEILARWDQEEVFDRFWLTTQNIDGLHRKAGSRRCSEIHG